MSRIGNRKLVIPEGVTVTEENGIVKVTGPKGELTTTLDNGITLTVEENTLVLSRASDEMKAMHGTMNANINNMILGVFQNIQRLHLRLLLVFLLHLLLL